MEIERLHVFYLYDEKFVNKIPVSITMMRLQFLTGNYMYVCGKQIILYGILVVVTSNFILSYTFVCFQNCVGDVDKGSLLHTSI